MLKSDNVPRSHCPLVKIKNTFPARDNIVRTVGLKNPHGALIRPVVKICLLEKNELNHQMSWPIHRRGRMFQSNHYVIDVASHKCKCLKSRTFFYWAKSIAESGNNHVTKIISSLCSRFLENLISHKSNEKLLKF